MTGPVVWWKSEGKNPIDDNLTALKSGNILKSAFEALFHSYNILPDHIQLEIHVEDPIGLIINELITNAS
jgi:two-component sensor histidine kinase